MKIRTFLLIASLVITSVISAQTDFTKPDYDKIQKAIKDKKSDNYFPVLMERFSKRDTTMTDENYRNLYFGFMFQKKYNPYSHSDKAEELRNYADLEKLDKAGLKKALDLIDEIYKENPFDLNAMNMQAYAYQLYGNPEMSKKVAATLGKILDVILQSGDGRTCETAFHVQSIQHEYLILNIFDLQSVSQSLIDHCDYLAFEKDKFKIPGLYFDISKMRDSLMGTIGK
ncbi:MAG: DUF4919 domain-containing protein [Flavobacterium sp.]|nr:MAG: DUF4919 domain-containing protein [Flavobacterium sp.]